MKYITKKVRFQQLRIKATNQTLRTNFLNIFAKNTS